MPTTPEYTERGEFADEADAPTRLRDSESKFQVNGLVGWKFGGESDHAES